MKSIVYSADLRHDGLVAVHDRVGSIFRFRFRSMDGRLADELASRLPDGTVADVRALLRGRRVVVRLSRPRRTKLGDHRPPGRGVPHHRITVNSDLNPYAFLTTLLHEIAHMTTWELPRPRRIRPHGREWKREFSRLLDPFISASVLPADVAEALSRSMQNPTASSCTDRGLVLALARHDPPGRRLPRLEDLPAGSIFRVDSGQVFRMGPRLRSRYRCFEQPGGREYRVHSLAQVEPLKKRDGSELCGAASPAPQARAVSPPATGNSLPSLFFFFLMMCFFGSSEAATPMSHTPSSPAVRPFGSLPDGRAVSLYTLEVPGGWRAEVTDYGAILTSLIVPGAGDGKPVDVVLGFDTLSGYLAVHPYFGATCGRVANRIAGGRFELDGKRYSLAKNNGDNHLHGGLIGFDKKLWKATPRLSDRGPAVDFEMVSPDGDEGYPGAVTARVAYTLTPDGELWIEMSATTDAPTLLNMAHHSYWNLAGQGSGSIQGHELAVTADTYLPVDAGSIPTGELAPVAGTPFDLRPERRPAVSLRDAIAALPPSGDGKNPGGLDHNFVVRGWKPDGSLRSVALLRDRASGRTLEVLSDQPGIQVYTGNNLDGSVKGKNGVAYGRHAAICLETQKYPDAIHHPDWPSPRLDPGQTYRHTMVHRFGTR